MAWLTSWTDGGLTWGTPNSADSRYYECLHMALIERMYAALYVAGFLDTSGRDGLLRSLGRLITARGEHLSVPWSCHDAHELMYALHDFTSYFINHTKADPSTEFDAYPTVYGGSLPYWTVQELIEDIGFYAEPVPGKTEQNDWLRFMYQALNRLVWVPYSFSPTYQDYYVSLGYVSPIGPVTAVLQYKSVVPLVHYIGGSSYEFDNWAISSGNHGNPTILPPVGADFRAYWSQAVWTHCFNFLEGMPQNTESREPPLTWAEYKIQMYAALVGAPASPRESASLNNLLRYISPFVRGNEWASRRLYFISGTSLLSQAEGYTVTASLCPTLGSQTSLLLTVEPVYGLFGVPYTCPVSMYVAPDDGSAYTELPEWAPIYFSTIRFVNSYSPFPDRPFYCTRLDSFTAGAKQEVRHEYRFLPWKDPTVYNGGYGFTQHYGTPQHHVVMYKFDQPGGFSFYAAP